ncbi:MAG: glucarate dehydratase [Saprospiraceae bacterium]|nr:glucarate dehydratase [Saprospiraceae bacterium]
MKEKNQSFGFSRRDFVRAATAGAGLVMIPSRERSLHLGEEIWKNGPRIKEVNITPIAIEDPPLLNAAGLHAPYALRIIVEIVTEDGINGISEMHGGTANQRALEAGADLLTGMDPFQLNGISRSLLNHFGEKGAHVREEVPWDIRTIRRVFGAIEVACLDIIGKVTERPVVDLLGGKMRDKVPFAAYLFYKYEGAGGPLQFKIDPTATGWKAGRQANARDPVGMVDQAKSMCQEFGFKSLKVKGGVFDPQVEVDTVKALGASFGPEYPIRIDPNAAWKVETGIRYGKQLEGLIEYLEDPVRGQENMAGLKKALNMPFATNMCTTAFEHLPASIELGSEDIILTDHHYWGGMRACMDLARICQTFGRGVSMHSNSHLGISLAAMVHLGAAYPFLTAALDTHYPWQIDEVITQGRFTFEQGSVQVPSGPGLGVDLDRIELALLHQNYLDCGLTRRDDQLEMQKVRPGWKRIPERW